MSDTEKSTDELAGSEQPFVQHLMELRDRLLYGVIGLAICMALLAFWPGPSGLIDLIAVPIRAHMPPDAKLIAVGVFSPFFVPIKVLAMAALLLSLPWWMYQVWAFVAPGLYSHEKRFAIPLIVLGSLLAYVGIAFVQFFVLDKMFGFIQQFTPASVAATPDIASYVEAILSLYLAFGLAFQVPIVVVLLVKMNMVTVEKLKEFRGYFIVVAFVIAAVVTPPDVISQLALAVPMCILYLHEGVPAAAASASELITRDASGRGHARSAQARKACQRAQGQVRAHLPRGRHAAPRDRPWATLCTPLGLHVPYLQGGWHARQSADAAPVRPRARARLDHQARARLALGPVQMPLLPCRELDGRCQGARSVTTQACTPRVLLKEL